jgi:gliding motility-associated-like protein
VTITTVLTSKPGLALDLESPITTKPGTEITLDIAGNFAIDSVRFISPFSLSCSNCLDPKFKPLQAGVVQVTAFDEDGCSASGEIRILLNKKFDIYVPNIFKPGSSQNGFFSVFADLAIPNVRNFNVYDRWGNALFSRDNMPTNDPTAGWDGSYRGQKMQPGVYVYYFVVDLPDGSEEVYSGDVTIIE